MVSTQLLKCTQAVAPAHQACDPTWRGWWIAFRVLGSGVLLPILLLMVCYSSLDANEDSPMPSCTRPPMKTYKVRSHISLKLKIKQETRLSKVVHNKALDPVHQPSPAPQCAEPLQCLPGHHQPGQPEERHHEPHATAGHTHHLQGPGPVPPWLHLPLCQSYKEHAAISVTPLPAKVDKATSGLIR